MNAHTPPIFYKLKLLTLKQIHNLQAGLFMFSAHNKLLSEKFQDMFQKNSQVHSYQTRQANYFRIPYFRTNIREFTIAYQGPKFWNSIATKLKLISSMKIFEINLKKHFIESWLRLSHQTDNWLFFDSSYFLATNILLSFRTLSPC